MLDLLERSWNLWEKIINPETNVIQKGILIFTAISYFFKHPRTRVRAILCFLLFSLVIVLYHFEHLDTPLYLLIPLIYGVISLYIAKKEPFPLLVGKRFKDYLREIKGKSNIEAYKILKKVDEKNLYPKEIEILNRKKYNLLIQMGDLYRAEEISKKILDKENLEYLFSFSLFLEYQGKLNESEDILKRIKSRDIKDSSLKAMIYNNYGRVCKLGKNNSEALISYNVARKIIVDEKLENKDLINTVYSNLIEVYCMEKQYRKMEEIKNEYKEKLNLKDKNHLLNFMNLETNLVRENESIKENELKSREQYEILKKGLEPEKLHALETLTLRLSFNSQYDLTFILDDIARDIDEYFKYPMPIRYNLFKEVKIVAEKSERLRYLYPEIFRKTMEYYREYATKDLEDYLYKLEPEEIFAKSYILNEIIGVEKTLPIYDSEKILKKIEDVLKIYEQNTLYTKMVEQRLNMIDECHDRRNVEQTTFGNLLYIYRTRILQNLEKAIEEIKKIEKHPEVPIFYLRIAYYYLSQNRKEEAKKYYEKFKLSRVSINHYADWLKNYDRVLNQLTESF